MNLKVCVALLALLAAFPQLSLADNAVTHPAAARVAAQYANRPLSFEPAAFPGRYLARSGSYSMSISAGESLVAVPDSKSGPARVLRFAFDKSDPAARIEALDVLPGVTNYYIGQDERNWRLGVPNFARLRTKGVYPGVDVVYYGDQRRLEFDFVVAPMADASVIALAISGMDKLSIAADGDLVAEVNGREVRFARLYAYQRVAGEKRPVSVEYVLAGEGKAQLRLGEYDKSQELVIDPTLSYSTYLGGSQDDTATGIAVDASENAYITGQTCSSDFIVPVGVNPSGTAFQGVQGACNAYVTKLTSGGNTVVFTTFIAGTSPANAFAVGTGIALDNPLLNTNIKPNGYPNVYVVGTTSFTNMPLAGLLPSAYPQHSSTYNGGDSDVFIAILDSTTGTLIRSTYLGGSMADIGSAIAVDPQQNVVVAGQTNSFNFPTYNGFEPITEAYVAFVTKLDFGLHIAAPVLPSQGGIPTAGAWPSPMTPRVGSDTELNCGGPICPSVANPASTYYFFSAVYGGQLVAPPPTWSYPLDASTTNPYAVPYGTITTITPVCLTQSPPVNYPALRVFAQNAGNAEGVNWGTCSSYQLFSNIADNGGVNWLVLGIAPFIEAHYATTEAYGVALDPAGDVFLVGGSNTADLHPSLPGPAPTTGGLDWLGQADTHYSGTGAWIIKILGHDTAAGTKDAGSPVYLTPVGTNPTDVTQNVNAARGVVVDSQGHAYIVGTATGGIYTTTGSLNPTVIGGQDAFIVRMNTSGSGIDYSTYLGGAGNDQGLAVTVDAGGWAYIAGSTQSSDISLINPLINNNVTQSTIKGTQDAYIAKLSPDGTSLIMSAYLGGAGVDQANAVALGNNPAGPGIFDIFVAGNTTSTDFPVQAPVQANNKGNGDAFVTKIDGRSFPYLTVTSGPTLTFADSVAVGWSSTAQPVTVQASQATVQFTSITASGDFTQTNTCGAPPNAQLTPPGTCTINVTFTPTAIGTRNGVLTIVDDATNSPQTVGLIGTGVLVQDLVLPTSLTFATTTVGTTSAAQTVTVKNTDPAAKLIMSSLVATGDFNVSSNGCTSLLTPGQSCTIGVTFTPSTAGSRIGTLVINGNGNDFPFTVGLSGTGNGTGTSPTGTTPDFTLTGPTTQAVKAGTPATFSISLAAIAGFNQAVSLSYTGTGSITCSVSPTQVTVSGSTAQTATVTVNVSGGGGVIIGSLEHPAKVPFAGGPGRPGRLLALMLPFGTLGLVLHGRRRRWLALLLLLLCLGVCVGMIGCGGGGSGSASGQQQQITITGTPSGGSTAHSVTVSLTVS
jgi:hypothetical protein